MTLPTAVRILLFGALSATPVGAQTLLPVDSISAGRIETLSPEVAQVTTGGSWTSGAAEGSYRAIVLTGGFEHVSSRLFLQWLSGNSAVTREISLGHGWSLGAPTLELVDGSWHLTIAGFHNRELIEGSWRIRLGPPDVAIWVEP